MRMRRLIKSVAMAATLSVGLFAFAACGDGTTGTGGTGGGGGAAGGGGGGGGGGGLVQSGDRIVQGGLPDPATFTAHQHAGPGTSTFGDFAYEGLIRFQRGTDDIMFMLAESVEHTDNQSIFTIRENARWNDGTQFTSRDVWAFYAITGNAPANWLESVDIIDDRNVAFTWREPVPTPEIRMKLVAQEVHHGRIPYHIYGEFAHRLQPIWDEAPRLTQEQMDAGIRRPFGTDLPSSPELTALRDEIFQEFVQTPPNDDFILIGTGPFVNLPGHTMNEGIMVQNPYFWWPEIQTWDRIIIRATTDATRVNMLQNEDIHWMDGTLPLDMTLSLLNANENLVYFPMNDPASHGLIFNQGSTNAPMYRREFRQALNFIAHREAMRDIGSYQSAISQYAVTGLPPSLLPNFVSPAVLDSMTVYYHNHERAEELLHSIGASRASNGNWQDADGNNITLRIGINSGWHISTLVVPIFAAQLNAFGIPTEVIAVEGAVFGPQSEAGEFDMAWEWVDVAWNFSHPFFTMGHLFSPGQARRMQLEMDPVHDQAIFSVTDMNGASMDVLTYINMLPFLPPDEARAIYERLIWAVNEYAVGINFYQNVTGSWENIAHVQGLPFMDRLGEGTEHPRWAPLPVTLEERMLIHNLNVHQASNVRKFSMISAIPQED